MAGNELVHGQLYRVGITCRAPQQRCTMELLVVASSTDDARVRLPWLYDFSGWDEYRIDWAVKEPDRCVALNIRYERTNESTPDGVIEREKGTQNVFQRNFSSGLRFDVAAMATLYAKDEKHARKKLAERIVGGSDSVRYSIAELAPSSPYASPRDVSVFERAAFVRG